MYDASSRKDIRAAEKRAATAERNRAAYIVNAMVTTIGRAWFFDLLERCHCFQEPFTGNALQEAFLKGERTIGLAVLADIHRYAPDQYIAMMTEANHRELANGRRDTVDNSDGTTGKQPGGSDPDWGDSGSVGTDAEPDGLYN